MNEKSYKVADLCSGLALAALGAYIVVQAWQWEYLGPDGPGPGFFPLWQGIAMVVLSGALIASSAIRDASAGDGAIAWGRTGRALATWLALVASVAAFRLLGFAISFALFTFFIVAAMYRRPMRVAATVALAGAAAFYLLFAVALGVSLPVGVLGF